MKTKKRHWKGELRKPIYVGSVPIDGTNEELPKWIVHEAIEKLPLLMEHYEIADKDDYFSLALALALAMDLVPGFQVKPAALKLTHGNGGAVIGKRRSKIWSRARLLRWLNAVKEEKQRRGFSTDREAIRFIIMQKGEWSRPINRDEQKLSETLESRLQDAKRIEREEREGGPALDPESDAILRELQQAARFAMATVPAATVHATLPLEVRFAALCLPFSIEQRSEN